MQVHSLRRIFYMVVVVTTGMSCFTVMLMSFSLIVRDHSNVSVIPTSLLQNSQTDNSSIQIIEHTRSMHGPLKEIKTVKPYNLVFDSPPQLPYLLRSSNNHSGVYPVLEKPDQKHVIPTRPRLILLYKPPGWLGMMFSGVVSDCPASCSCSENPDDITEADAVVFNAVNLPLRAPQRKSSQTWVFFGLEPPAHYTPLYTLTQWRRVFNWKMTYRLDSDIVMPYSVLTRTPETNKNYTAIASSKWKAAAWLVSHCRTQSKRERYVQELQKHYPVDIFGKCGPGGKVNLTKVELLKDYRFFLAFENSLCIDYITEKLFELFDRRIDVIPIVRGGADYSKLVPDGTYINTADFPSPRALAGYLKYLEKNVTAVAELLREKDKYVTEGFRKSINSGFCDICVRLHSNEHSPPSDTANWLNHNACSEPHDIGA